MMYDGFYDAFKEKQLEEQVQRMLKSRRYSRREIAWITNTEPDFVEDVRTRTNAKWIVRVFRAFVNVVLTILAVSAMLGLIMLYIANNSH